MGTQRRPLIDRIFAKLVVIDDEDSCWPWTGGVNDRGYPTVGSGGRNGKTLYVHRVMCEHFNGPIPDGFEVDHECENTLCGRPKHLRAIPSVLNNHYRNHGRLIVLPLAAVEDDYSDLD